MHRLGSLFLIAVLLCGIFMPASIMAIPASAAEEAITISHTSPAIPADVGQTIDLSNYRLQVAATTVIEPEKLTWSSSEVTVSDNQVTAPAKGVYAPTPT